MPLLLLVLAVVCLVVGVINLINGALLFGLVLVAVGVVLGTYGRGRLE